MQRNGTTAYLEAYDDGDGVMPILGELGAFIKEIEIKSDMPMVKVKFDDRDIKFGITHNYKGTEYNRNNKR